MHAAALAGEVSRRVYGDGDLGLSDLVRELTTKKLRRGAHRTLAALNADIRAWIETCNENPQPFVWTKTADQILDPIARLAELNNVPGFYN